MDARHIEVGAQPIRSPRLAGTARPVPRRSTSRSRQRQRPQSRHPRTAPATCSDSSLLRATDALRARTGRRWRRASERLRTAPRSTSTTGRHTFSVTATSSDGQTTTTTISYQVLAPDNEFTVGQIRTSVGGKIRFSIRVPGPGTIDVLATVWKNNIAHAATTLQPAPRRFVFGRKHASAPQAGTFKLTLRPNARGRRLRRHHRYRVTLRLWVTYQPTVGRARSIGFYGLHPPQVLRFITPRRPRRGQPRLPAVRCCDMAIVRSANLLAKSSWSGRPRFVRVLGRHGRQRSHLGRRRDRRAASRLRAVGQVRGAARLASAAGAVRAPLSSVSSHPPRSPSWPQVRRPRRSCSPSRRWSTRRC